MFLHVLVAFLLGLLTLSQGQIQLKAGVPHVALSNTSSLSGLIETSRGGRTFSSFVGIPYGKVQQRFEEAVQAPAWNGVFNAVTPGPICVQAVTGSTQFGMMGEEDCLSLNVYVPTNSSTSGGKKKKEKEALLPVMVYVHGGGFVNGAGSIYGAKFFMDENVILVTFNYRLNVFGFLSTGDEVIPGNNGMKDQVLALKWVQENIKSFGGNPAKVTVFGESAGGASVHLLFLSSTTNGLFQTAIAQSGSALATWAYDPNPRENAVKLASFLKCPTTAPDSSQITSQEILDCLRKEPVEKLLEGMFKFTPRWPPVSLPLQFVPVKEPIPTTAGTPFLTDSPWNILNDRKTPLKNSTLVLGVVEHEGASIYSGTIFSDPKLVEELDSNWNKILPRALELDKYLSVQDQEVVAEKVRKFYFQERPISAESREELMNLYSDAFFIHSIRKAGILTGGRGKKNPVFLYRFAQEGPASLMKVVTGIPIADEEAQKVCHANELFYLFNMESVAPGVTLDLDQEQVSKDFVKLWTSIAIKGKPKHFWGEWREHWPSLSREEIEGRAPLKWFKIDSDPAYVTEGEWEERMDFWDQLYKDHFQDHFKTPKSSNNKKVRSEL